MPAFCHYIRIEYLELSRMDARWSTVMKNCTSGKVVGRVSPKTGYQTSAQCP